MPRVIGIDPGTVSIDLCGLEDGAVFLDRALPTADALADVAAFVDLLRDAQPVLIAGPSGYGLPLTPVSAASDDVLRLAYLAPAGESGGIGGLRVLASALRAAELPVIFTPGVVHLPTVPDHRKVNRVDMGTADKVCAAALAIHDQATRRGCPLGDVSFILLELGGAFSAAIAVDSGRIVDGMGGSVGPIGLRAAGALDGEVAYLAGSVTKAMLFRGGVESMIDDAPDPLLRIAEPTTRAEHRAREAFLESVIKAVAALLVAVPHPFEILLSGRVARNDGIARALHLKLSPIGPTRALRGFAHVSKEAAQGAALIADGLAGGSHTRLTDTLGLREAAGTVLDNLFFVSPDAARRRLGLA